MISSEPCSDLNKITEINMQSLVFSDLKHQLQQVLGTAYSKGAILNSGVDGCTESDW